MKGFALFCAMVLQCYGIMTNVLWWKSGWGGEYTVEALMLSRGQGESRKTFSRPAGLNDTFLLLDPIFASMRVWFALFLFSDPDCSFLPALCQPFSILSGSGTHFFCSGTQFLLLYGSGSHFFSSQTRGALLFWHYVNLFPILYGSGTRFFSSGTSPFPSISPGFQFVWRFFTHFSTLLHTFFTFIRYLNHCQEEIPIDTISFS